jgi:hypothetical protein
LIATAALSLNGNASTHWNRSISTSQFKISQCETHFESSSSMYYLLLRNIGFMIRIILCYSRWACSKCLSTFFS